jgi:hypothetical protein
VKRWLVWGGFVLVSLVMLLAVAGAGASSLSITRYAVGESVLFQIETQNTCWWSCCGCCNCACPEIQVSGWRVVDGGGTIVYAVSLEAPIAVPAWTGSWNQANTSGVPVAAGNYVLYVDTTVGMLSRSFLIYDPCCCCWGWLWPCFTCEEASRITQCCCRITLTLSHEQRPCSPCSWPCCSGCS